MLVETEPILLDLIFNRGGDWVHTWNIFENDKVTPKNTTGFAMTMTIQDSQNGQVYDTLTEGNSKIIHTPTGGQFNLRLTAAQVNAYKFTNAEYKIVMTYGSNTRVLQIGKVKVQ